MNKINKSEIKGIYCNNLSSYFMNLGYKIYQESNTSLFVLKHENVVIHFFFNFFTDLTIGVSPLFLTFYEVEDYFLEIGIPNQELNQYKKKNKYNLPTIELNRLPENLFTRPLQTHEEVNKFAHNFIEFYEKEGDSFLNRYKRIPDVFKDISKIDNWKQLISGMGEAYIKGLIISKLCNDPLFGEKLDKINGMIQEASEWLPYWEKYKEVLLRIKPKYNLA